MILNAAIENCCSQYTVTHSQACRKWLQIMMDAGGRGVSRERFKNCSELQLLQTFLVAFAPNCNLRNNESAVSDAVTYVIMESQAKNKVYSFIASHNFLAAKERIE